MFDLTIKCHHGKLVSQTCQKEKLKSAKLMNELYTKSFLRQKFQQHKFMFPWILKKQSYRIEQELYSLIMVFSFDIAAKTAHIFFRLYH